MASFENDFMSSMEIKEEIFFKDEPLEYCPEEPFSSISPEHSALQALKQEVILPVSDASS